MKTIVKDVRVRTQSRVWRVDVEVELDPAEIGRSYASYAHNNKSKVTKQLGGLVIVRRIGMPREEVP